MSLETYIAAVPKAELHVHVEGTIGPATMLELSKRHGVDLPAETVEGLKRWFVYRDFDHFVEIFVTACRCLRDLEDYELMVYEYGAEMARQNIRYAELTFSPSTHYVLGVPHDVYLTGLERGRERARRDFGVEMRWIFNIVRRWQDPTRTVPLADYTTDAAIEGKEHGVVALGLAGAEAGAPPEPFVSWFDRARSEGLHSAPHAGEMAGPESVWGAIRALGAERIGHGVRAVEDPELVAYLGEHAVPLEVCPISNVCLGVYPRLEEHPLPQLHTAGVLVTVNSDDPPLFNTTLTGNLATLVHPLGLDVQAIDEIVVNGVRASFLPAERKAELEALFRREMADLRKEQLGDEDSET